METTTEKQIQYDPHRKDQIESIKARIAELEEYKIELEEFYNKLKSELGKKRFVMEKKSNILPSSLNTYTNEKALAYIDTLLAGNFFEIPKTELEVLDNCREHFDEDFHPRHMIAVLNHYTNKKSGIPILDYNGKNECGRKLFLRVNK